MHNTHEQNEAFRKAFDETNARWKAQTKPNKIVLNWVYCNGWAFDRTFEKVEFAEKYSDNMGFYQSPTVDRVWIDGPNGQTWLKEKNK